MRIARTRRLCGEAPQPNLHFGWHAGAGAAWRLGRAALFAEARVHHVADGGRTRLLPLSLGLRF